MILLVFDTLEPGVEVWRWTVRCFAVDWCRYDVPVEISCRVYSHLHRRLENARERDARHIQMPFNVTFFIVAEFASGREEKIRQELVHDLLDILFVILGKGHLPFDEKDDQRRRIVQDGEIIVPKQQMRLIGRIRWRLSIALEENHRSDAGRIRPVTSSLMLSISVRRYRLRMIRASEFLQLIPM